MANKIQIAVLLLTLTHMVALSGTPAEQEYNGKKLVFADFSALPDGRIRTNCTALEGKGIDNNPYYKHSIRLLYEESELSAKFDIQRVPEKATLIVEHLSSTSSDCPGGGYSPVTIILNGYIIARNFSPRSHGMITDSWDVSGRIRKGENEIRWKAGELCSHYWIKKFEIVTPAIFD